MIKVVLFCHAITGFVAVMALIHCCIWAMQFKKGDFAKSSIQKKLNNIACGLYICTVITGFIMVPSYESNVEPLFFESGTLIFIKIFRLKFFWAVMGCFLCLATAAYRGSFDPEEDNQRLEWYVRYIGTVTLVAILVAIIGLTLAVNRPV